MKHFKLKYEFINVMCFFFREFFYLCVCVCTHVSVCLFVKLLAWLLHVCSFLWGPEDGVESVAVGVTGTCEAPDKGARNQTQSSWRTVSTLTTKAFLLLLSDFNWKTTAVQCGVTGLGGCLGEPGASVLPPLPRERVPSRDGERRKGSKEGRKEKGCGPGRG